MWEWQGLEGECLDEREQDHLHMPCDLPSAKQVKGGGGVSFEWANCELNGG